MPRTKAGHAHYQGPLPRRIPKPSAKLGQRVRQKARAREVDPRPSPELETELADLFVEANCRRPWGELSDARQQEWEGSLSRLAASKCRSAETATIQRAVKSAQELHHVQLVRGREGLNDVDHVDLSAFASKGTQAPQRAVQGLRWFSNAGKLGWVLPTNAPLRAGRVAKPNLATTVSPPMVAHLENQIQEMWRMGVARWSALVRSAALPPHPMWQAPQDHGVDDARLLTFFAQTQAEDPAGGLYAIPSTFLN